jgi:hypothetical protein
MPLQNMVALPSLPTEPTQGIELLVDHSRSHIMTFTKYLGIMLKKAIDKVVIQEHSKAK